MNNPKDLKERLLNFKVVSGGSTPSRTYSLCKEAADAIDQAEALIEELAEALETVMQHGHIDNSESRMNQVAHALTTYKAWKEWQ